jgi:hypothetical protein
VCDNEIFMCHFYDLKKLETICLMLNFLTGGKMLPMM